MIPPQALAYPLLLAALYGVYRVGRGRVDRPSRRFEVLRALALATGLALVALLHVRFALAGRLDSPLAFGGAVLSIAAMTGLLALHLLTLKETWRGPAGHAPAGPS